MNEKRVKYYVVRSGGEVSDVYRVVWHGQQTMEGQVWVDGEWIDDDAVIRDVVDLVAEDSTEAEVNGLIAAGGPSE